MMENLKAQQAPTLQLGDAAAVVASILAGAHIVRVHDVAGILPAVRIADAVLTATRPCRSADLQVSTMGDNKKMPT